MQQCAREAILGMIAETEQPDIALQLRVIVGVTGSDQIIISGGALAAGTGHIQTSSRISGPQGVRLDITLQSSLHCRLYKMYYVAQHLSRWLTSLKQPRSVW